MTPTAIHSQLKICDKAHRYMREKMSSKMLTVLRGPMKSALSPRINLVEERSAKSRKVKLL